MFAAIRSRLTDAPPLPLPPRNRDAARNAKSPRCAGNPGQSCIPAGRPCVVPSKAAPLWTCWYRRPLAQSPGITRGNTKGEAVRVTGREPDGWRLATGQVLQGAGRTQFPLWGHPTYRCDHFAQFFSAENEPLSALRSPHHLFRLLAPVLLCAVPGTIIPGAAEHRFAASYHCTFVSTKFPLLR